MKELVEERMEQTLNHIMKGLMGLKYHTSDGWELPVVSSKSESAVRTQVQSVLTEHLAWELDNGESELGELRAKVFFYEQMIQKSNFKSFLEDVC